MSGALPEYIERFFGLDQAASGEGTVWTLDHAWQWAPWITLIFVVAVTILVAGAYALEIGAAGKLRRILLGTLRMAAIGIVLLMLAEWVLALHRTGLPYVVVLVDDSASMGIADHYDAAMLSRLTARLKQTKLDEATRLNLAKTLLLENDSATLSTIADRYKLKLYFVSDTVRAQSGSIAELRTSLEQLTAEGAASRLGDAVRQVLNDLRGTPPAAMVLLTDGITTQGPTLSEAAAYARRKGVPIFTIAIGSEQPTRDLELTDLLVDEVVFVDDVVNFDFKLTGTGLVGRKLEVRLLQKGRDTPVATQPVTIAGDGEPQKVRLQFRPTEIGQFEFTVETPLQPEETRADNNRQTRVIQVRKEQIRVLLVQAYPNYEYRYLKHMLQRDPTIQLRTVLQDADVDYASIDPTALAMFPVRREELFEYDVVIFGDVNPSFLSATAMEHLAAFVQEKGGGLVFIAGPRFTPLAFRDTPLGPLVPIDLASSQIPDPRAALSEGFVVTPTELGLATPPLQLGDGAAETAQIWARLPPVYWLLETDGLKPAARVLAEHPTRATPDGQKLPVIVMQYVGAGKVLFHATDETWRWRFQVGDVYFARYWVQTIRYLSRSKLLGKDRAADLSSDRREYRQGESVRLRLRFLDERLAPAQDDGVAVMIERAGHTKRQITLARSPAGRGVFEGTISKPAEGEYHAWVVQPTLEGEPAADFRVVAPPGEFAQVQVDVRELQRTASETRGQFYRFEQAGALADDLPRGRQVPIETLPSRPLWNQWPVLFVLLALLVSEWVLRKRSGML